jgi:UDP-N-acetylmuramoylalanine--D-glutamate ligase
MKSEKKFHNKKIVIFGLGNYKNGSGVSAAVFFAKRGAKLLITDLKTKKQLENSVKKLSKYKKQITYVFGRHREKDFEKADFVFKNPGVRKDSPYLKIAAKNGAQIINDWTIYFLERPDNMLIGITGTKGKSTATMLIYEFLKNAGKDAVLCGNIGKSPLAILNRIKKDTVVVAELSSWLLQEFKTSPRIAVVTNLMPDHMDKYNSLREYYRDKENIFRFQKKNDFLLLNTGEKNLEPLAKKAKSKILWYKNHPLLEIAKILKIPKSTALKTIKNFEGVRGRQELVKIKNGVKYINDTTATTPDATIYALRNLNKKRDRTFCLKNRTNKHKNKRIVLISGGMDKNLDYKNLACEIPKYCKALILFKGNASDKILHELRFIKQEPKKNHDSLFIIHDSISDMKSAVQNAKKYAAKGDIVLLSPGAASFNIFKNEFDRGSQFVKIVKKT